MRMGESNMFRHVSVWHKPSRYFQVRNEELIGRSLDDCLRNRGMTENKNCRNRGMTYSILSSLRGANRGQANFELEKKENRKIP